MSSYDELEEKAKENLLRETEGTPFGGFKPMDREQLESEFVTKNNFVPIPADELPSRSFFYDKGTQVLVKSASVQEVKHFSSINDEDFFDIQDKMSTLFNVCVRISKNGNPVSYRDLSEFDKIYVFFAVRERTFLADGRQSTISHKSPCPSCGEEISVEIEKGNLGYYSIPDSIMKFYDDELRSFVINHEKFESPLEIFVPTVGVTEKIFQYIKEAEIKKQRGEGGYYDLADLTIIMYITKDWRDIDDSGKYIKRKLEEIKRWSVDKYKVATHVTKTLKVGVDPMMEVHCSKCGKENKVPVRFPEWSTLLSDESIIGELFGDSSQADL